MNDASASIDTLNLARAMELQAISQYMGHHYTLDNANYPALADAMKRVAIQEMRHAEMLGIRIRELGGVPVTTLAGSPDTSPDVYVVYNADMILEADTVVVYETYIQKLEANNDRVSAQLLKKIIVEEEAHQQYFTDQLRHITELGPQYLSVQASPNYESAEYIQFLVK